MDANRERDVADDNPGNPGGGTFAATVPTQQLISAAGAGRFRDELAAASPVPGR